MPKGHLHPITVALRDIRRIFSKIGFSIALGPEIETEFYNFDALNFPKDHPSRDMHDTFWLKSDSQGSERTLLRTHTSPVQVRYMEKNKPPLKIIVPGKTFRNEATDATHEAQFYQVEGLSVGKNVSLSDLKGTLTFFFREFFGEDIEVRFRPSYFPFTEPSVEVDISCYKCKGEGCNICKESGWIEVFGAGMVHPNVFKAAGVDETSQGFAFGGGVDRLIMLKYGIEDVRQFYWGDLHLTNQF